MTIQNRLAEIDEELARLGARKRALLEAQGVARWPKWCTLDAHCTGGVVWEGGTALRLTDAQWLALVPKLSTVALYVKVTEDGTVTILACDGRPLRHDE